jgi:glucose-6-phosphate isomerase
MESNGKSIDKQGRVVTHATGPIVWGGSGNQAQHSYYQLLCQGTHSIAADLVSVDSNQPFTLHHLCLAQKDALTSLVEEVVAQPKKRFVINHIRLKEISPKTIGALIALYEHKIYTQSVIWNINPFDQPGVELSKQLMRRCVSGA